MTHVLFAFAPLVVSICGCSRESKDEPSVPMGTGYARIGNAEPEVVVRSLWQKGDDGVRTLELQAPRVLEYFPFVAPGAPDGIVIECRVRDGDTDTLLDASTPYRVPEHKAGGGRAGAGRGDRYGLFDAPVRVDLSHYTGRKIDLTWRVVGPPVGVTVGLAHAALRPPEARRARHPHILMICSDTHRADYALAGEGPRLMPNLKVLADHAVVYDAAYSNSSWTVPAITSTLTGLFPRYHKTGLKTGAGELSDEHVPTSTPGSLKVESDETYYVQSAYPKRLVTLPEALRRLGYRTALVCANGYVMASGICYDGFDIVVNATGRPGRVINEEAGLILEHLADDGPLFVMVHYMDVHDFERTQFTPKHGDLGIYDADREQVVESYEAAVQQLDRALGAILSLWRDAFGLRESLIIFFSDHGEHLYDPGHPDLAAALESIGTDSPGFRRLAVPVLNHGNSMQEELLRVPLLVRYPGYNELNGTREASAVSLVDLFPTVMDVLDVGGAELPADLSGRSLLPATAGPLPEQRPIFADYQLYGDEMSSVRLGPHKLVLNLTNERQHLVDLKLPYLPAGEPGRVVENARVTDRLASLYAEYSEAAEQATENLRSDFVPDGERVKKDLKAIGYAR